MAEAHHRKKQPDQVRRALLDCVAKIAAEQGPAGITIQAVAEAAGVTKGGLLHHFSSKLALFEGLFEDLLDQFDTEIDAHMSADPVDFGRFTRAYVRACFADRARREGSHWAALSVAMVSEPALRHLWTEWIDERLARHRDTDSAAILAMVRMATDGVWFDDLLRQNEPDTNDLHQLEPRLMALTEPRKH